VRIGILGSGLMGGKLGTIFARAGHEVVFSYARRKEKLERLARDAGRNARASRSHYWLASLHMKEQMGRSWRTGSSGLASRQVPQGF